MNRRDTALLDAIDNVNAALNQITAALARIDAKVDGITTRLDEFHGEFATHRHGDDGEVT